MTRSSLLALVLLTPGVGAAQAPADPLVVFGLRPGAPLAEVASAINDADGGRLRCDRSSVDVRVSECRATLTLPQVSEPLELWLSAIDSVSGVVTIAGNFAPDELDMLRSELERKYGRVGARVQNDQWMMQWVRQGTMVRLTWRARQGAKAASVSLVDGRVLDGWTARRGTPRSASKPRAAKKKPAAPPDTAGLVTIESDRPR